MQSSFGTDKDGVHRIDDDTYIPEEEENDIVKSAKKISFPVDSIINAVIQDGDVMELLRILRYESSELDLNQRNHTGLTALHHAVLTNNLDSVKLLLNHGADIAVQDVYGFSPLHTAAALGFLQVTTLLIVFGADVFSLTKQSELPIDVAKDISVIRVLLNEMCLKIHTELYFRSIVLLALNRILTRFFECICYLYRTFLFAMKLIKYKYKTYRTRKHDALENNRKTVKKARKDVNCLESLSRSNSSKDTTCPKKTS